MRNDGHNPLLPPDIHIPDGEADVMQELSLSFSAADRFVLRGITLIA